MSCPTCDHTMQHMYHMDGCAYWCPRCGTVKVDGASHHVPKLVERCRQFDADTMSSPEWRRLGVAEAISRPEERPA